MVQIVATKNFRFEMSGVMIEGDDSHGVAVRLITRLLYFNQSNHNSNTGTMQHPSRNGKSNDSSTGISRSIVFRHDLELLELSSQHKLRTSRFLHFLKNWHKHFRCTSQVSV